MFLNNAHLFVYLLAALEQRDTSLHAEGNISLPSWLGRILTIDVLAARPGMFGKESPMESMHCGEGSSQDQAFCFLQPKNRRATTVAENRMSCPSLGTKSKLLTGVKVSVIHSKWMQ